MARINCSVGTCWNDTKRQRPAGMRCDELHVNITTVQDVENLPERNVKFRTSHISSNGYYGYLPIIPDIEDYAMDTSDAGAENSMGNGTHPKNDSSVSTLTNMKNVNVLSVGITLGRRKRNIEEDNSTDEPKRQRKEEQDALSEKVSDSSLQFIIEGCDLDLVEKLLKETHGCDLYHYYACDI